MGHSVSTSMWDRAKRLAHGGGKISATMSGESSFGGRQWGSDGGHRSPADVEAYPRFNSTTTISGMKSTASRQGTVRASGAPADSFTPLPSVGEQGLTTLVLPQTQGAMTEPESGYLGASLGLSHNSGGSAVAAKSWSDSGRDSERG